VNKDIYNVAGTAILLLMLLLLLVGLLILQGWRGAAANIQAENDAV